MIGAGKTTSHPPSRYSVLDLFAGIGGFSLGLERTGGFETVACAEIERFQRGVLHRRLPHAKAYGDVCDLSARALVKDRIFPNVITGGFPCQDISTAGRGAGLAIGTRSGLWSEIARLVRELRPAYVIVENVAALLSGPSDRPRGWFGIVLGDLASCGYDAEWQNIPAAALGAPHRRERVWIVAYPHENGFPRRRNVFDFLEETGPRFPRSRVEIGEARVHGLRGDVWDASAARIFRVDDGVPDRLDRIGACGNAILPDIAELIGKAILWREGAL